MNNQPRIALVSNPASGKGRGQVVQAWLVSRLESLAISHSIFVPPWPSSLDAFETIWIVGGDGTLFHFINQFANLVKPLALFGAGSGNDFVWKLTGNKSLEASLEAALKGDSQWVDAGYCNGNLFLNGIGIGFDGSVVKSMRNKRTFLSGHAAYFATVIREIFRYQEKEIDIEFENGQTLHTRSFMIAIANGSRYGGGFLIAPQARINDGLLDMVMIKPISILKRLMHLPKVERGNHLALPFIESSTLKKICIRSPRLMDAHLDGEYMADTQFEIQIKPAKFRFIY